MSRAIYRYEVPVDGQWHQIDGCSPALYVACRDLDTVEFWAYPIPGAPGRQFCVYGTGQPIDEHATYIGTAIVPGGSLVWHLMAKW